MAFGVPLSMKKSLNSSLKSLHVNGFKRKFRTSLLAALFALLPLSSINPALAEVVREDQPKLNFDGSKANADKFPFYVWKDSDPHFRPKAVAIAVHGLAMHGRVYERLAGELVAQGIQVYAPDMRGYGQWQFGEEKGRTVSYKDSLEDLKALIKAVRAEHPGLPLYLIGESMGAGFSMRAAEALPDEVDGLILSSPALKRRTYVGPELVKDMASIVANPGHEVDLVPYMKKLASEDSKIVDETIHDPYVRKSLSCKDLIKSFRVISSNMDHAKGVSEHVPVLIIQGDQDRLLKHTAVVSLVTKLRSKDQTLRWMRGKGHLLIETSYIDPGTMSAIRTWLSEHVDGSGAQVAATPAKSAVNFSNAAESGDVAENRNSL